MPDDIGEVGDFRLAGNAQSGAEIVPEGHSDFAAGFCQTKERVPAISTAIASGAAADLSLCHLATDIVFRTIGVEGDLRALEHHQQLSFVGVQPLEQTVEGDKAGASREDAVEPRLQGGLALFAGR